MHELAYILAATSSPDTSNWFKDLGTILTSEPVRLAFCIIFGGLVFSGVFWGIKGIVGIIVGLIAFVGTFQMTWWVYNWFTKHIFKKYNHNQDALFRGVHLNTNNLSAEAILIGISVAGVLGFWVFRWLKDKRGPNMFTAILAGLSVFIEGVILVVVGTAAGWWGS